MAAATRLRERQWMYLGPIAAAPLAHIAVTLYRDAKTPRQKQLILGVGVIGSTTLTLGMRLYLMYHAGYAGKETVPLDRYRTVHSEAERKAIEDPGAATIAKEAFRGFG